MQVDYAILADAIQVVPTGKFSLLGGGVEEIKPSEYPFRMPTLQLLVRLIATVEDCETPHIFRLSFTDSHGSEMLPRAQLRAFTIDAQPATEIGLPISYLFVIVLPSVSFSLPGKYAFHIFVDGSEMKTLPLVCMPPAQDTEESTEDDIPDTPALSA